MASDGALLPLCATALLAEGASQGSVDRLASMCSCDFARIMPQRQVGALHDHSVSSQILAIECDPMCTELVS